MPAVALPSAQLHPMLRAGMPPKIRDLIRELELAGFVNRGGKGSHRNFVHPRIRRPIVLSGNAGDDAKKYQVIVVRSAVKESQR